MPNALLRLVLYPAAIAPNILSQPGCAVPFGGERYLPFAIRDWSYRRPARELRRNLYHRLADEYCYRIQVGCVAFQPEPLRLQRQRATPREGIVEGGKLVAIEQLLCVW